MTQPVDTVFVEIVPDFDRFDRELARELDRASRTIERELNRTLDEITDRAGAAGDAIGDGISEGAEEAERALRDLGDTAERELDAMERDASNASAGIDVLDASIEDLSETIEDDFDRAFRKFSNGWREFEDRDRTRITQGIDFISDSVNDLGATVGVAAGQIARALATGFVAVLARIPPLLIAVAAALPSVVGLIVSLGAVAVDAAGALALLPGVLASIGAVIAPLVIGFIGFGDAIEAVIDGDPEKIKEALEGLAPAARSVVGEFQRLLPALNGIADVVQQQIFEPLIGDLTRVFNIVRGPLLGGLSFVATSLGNIISDFADFLGEPETVEAFAAVFFTVGEILEAMRPGITALSRGIRDIVVASLPFIEQFSGFLADILEDFGAFLTESTKTGEFDAFMTSALQSLRAFGVLLDAAVAFLGALFTPETIAAGQLLLLVFADLLTTITEFLGTTAGQRFLEDLGILAVVAAGAISSLILILGFLFASITLFIGEVVRLFTSADEAIDTLKEATREGAEELVGFIRRVPQALASFASNFASAGARVMGSFFSAVRSQTSQLLGFVLGIPRAITGALGSLGSLLFQAGRNVINGLINGIRSRFGALRDAARDAARNISNFLPFSPAKEGPLSGRGSPDIAGESIGRMIAQGITAQVPTLQRATADFLRGLEPSAFTSQVATPTPAGVRVQPSAVAGTAEPARVILEIRGDGTAASAALIEVLRKGIRVRGGDVQVVLGDETRRNGGTR